MYQKDSKRQLQILILDLVVTMTQKRRLSPSLAILATEWETVHKGSSERTIETAPSSQGTFKKLSNQAQ